MNKKHNHIDHLFDKARNQQPESSFEETSGQFLNDLEALKISSLTQGVAKSFNFKYLIITQGKKGCYLKKNNTILHVPCVLNTAIDSTGA